MVSWRGELGKLKKGMHAQEVVDCVATSLSHGTEGGLGVTDRAQPGSERFGVLACVDERSLEYGPEYQHASSSHLHSAHRNGLVEACIKVG